MATLPFAGKKNRRLDRDEAVKEGVKILRDELGAALGTADSLAGLNAYPYDEERVKAIESLDDVERCLKTALAAIKDVRRNIK